MTTTPRVLQFISTTQDAKTGRTRFTVNESAVQFLSTLTGPLAVMATIGKFRMGKSYLLNKLVGIKPGQQGFGVSNSVQRCTLGLWISTETMTCKNSVTGETYPCLVVDVEGLSASNAEATEDNDSKLFALALLLSSFLVYNSKGVVDSESLAMLGKVIDLTKLIQLSTDSSIPMSRVLPVMMWLLRDFSLQLKDSSGKMISATTYMEQFLGSGDKDDHLKRSLRDLLPQRMCMTLPVPAVDEHLLQNLSQARPDQLRPIFTEQLNGLKQKLIQSIPLKTTLQGLPVNGPMLAQLARDLCVAFSSDTIPVIQNSWSSMSALSCQQALDQAVSDYKRSVALTSPSVLAYGGGIEDSHRLKALSVYDKGSTGPEATVYRDKCIDALKTVEREIVHTAELVVKNDLQACIHGLDKEVSKLTSATEVLDLVIKRFYPVLYDKVPLLRAHHQPQPWTWLSERCQKDDLRTKEQHVEIQSLQVKVKTLTDQWTLQKERNEVLESAMLSLTQESTQRVATLETKLLESEAERREAQAAQVTWKGRASEAEKELDARAVEWAEAEKALKLKVHGQVECEDLRVQVEADKNTLKKQYDEEKERLTREQESRWAALEARVKEERSKEQLHQSQDLKRCQQQADDDKRQMLQWQQKGTFLEGVVQELKLKSQALETKCALETDLRQKDMERLTTLQAEHLAQMQEVEARYRASEREKTDLLKAKLTDQMVQAKEKIELATKMTHLENKNQWSSKRLLDAEGDEQEREQERKQLRQSLQVSHREVSQLTGERDVLLKSNAKWLEESNTYRNRVVDLEKRLNDAQHQFDMSLVKLRFEMASSSLVVKD